MKTMHRTWLAGAVAGACLLGGMTIANASVWTLNAADISTGVNSNTINIAGGPTVDVSVQAGRTLQGKTTPAGTITRGSSGGVNGEIGVSPDFMAINFNENVFLNEFRVGWLFPDGEYGDQGDEVAVFETYDSSGNFLEDFFLRAEGLTSATLYGDSGLTAALGTIVNNVEVAQDGNPGPAGGGVWQIVGPNIFGNFNTLRMYGGDKPGVTGSAGSDFSFVSADGAAVIPVPAALPLLLTALGLLGFLRSRRNKLTA